MSVFFFFIDGFGIGEKNKNNLLYRQGLWKHLIGLNGLSSQEKTIHNKNYCVIPTDAALGVEGIPQSATGQTALFTGINAPQEIGGHVTGFPGEKLSAMLMEKSILKQLKQKGLHVTSANAYSTQYFESVKEKSRRVSASTLAIQAAEIPFRMMEDLKEGNAVFMDINHGLLKTRYADISQISHKKAADNLMKIIKNHDFVMFEYFWTDYVGHKGTLKEKKAVLRTLNAFIKYIVKTLDLNKNTLILSSDHGNIEELYSRKHSKNPVPTLIFSKNQKIQSHFISQVKTIQDVPLAILNGFEQKVLK